MTRRRIAVPAVAVALACVAPAAADAATIAPNKPCYGGGDALLIGGTGFTPGGQVSLTAAGAQVGVLNANPLGGILGATVVPSTTSTTKVEPFVATDLTNPAIVAATNVTRSAVRVSVRPARSSPYATRRIKVRGFTTGKTLYRHTKIGKRVSNRRQGSLKGACHTGSYRQRLFTRSARYGTYRVQFDTKRKYSSKTVQRVAFRVRVYKILVRRSSAAAASFSAPASLSGVREEWTRVK